MQLLELCAVSPQTASELVVGIKTCAALSSVFTSESCLLLRAHLSAHVALQADAYARCNSRTAVSRGETITKREQCNTG